MTAGGSFASLRDLADYGATLAFDDAELLAESGKGDPDKRALLLAGNRRGAVESRPNFRCNQTQQCHHWMRNQLKPTKGGRHLDSRDALR